MAAHIVVFDSGLGGTTVLTEIKQLLPHCQYSYVLDNAYFPYGDKDSTTLSQRINKIIGTVIDLVEPDLIVIACNTASTLVLEILRKNYTTPIVGVVPAIKPAALLSHNRHIGLLATDATVKRRYISNLESEFAVDCEVVRLPAQRLVNLAEHKMLYQSNVTTEVEKVVSSLMEIPLAHHIDTIVLGCTHFPALKDELVTLWPNHITVIDSGAAIAQRVNTLIGQAGDISSKTSPNDRGLVVTTLAEPQLELLTLMARFSIDEHKAIEI